MKTTCSRCVAVAALSLCTLAQAGWTVTSITGSASSRAFTKSPDMSQSDAQQMPVGNTTSDFTIWSSAMALITCGDGSFGQSLTTFTKDATTIRLDGSVNSTSMSFGAAIQGDSEAKTHVAVRFSVDGPTSWRLPVGWHGNGDGGQAAYRLQRAGGSVVIFNSATQPWQGAKGLLDTGDYELVASASSAAAFDAAPEPDTFLQNFGDGFFNVALELLPSVQKPALADFNLDGFIDFTDFDAFVEAFEAGDKASDMNADGFLDFTDFDGFVWVFEAGTPG